MKWLDFVTFMPTIKKESAKTRRIAERNKLMFEYELGNKKSAFARSDEDDFYSRIELFMDGLSTELSSNAHRYVKNLLAIKNYAVNPDERFSREYEEACDIALKLEETPDSDTLMIMEIANLEDAKDANPWA